MPRQKMDGKQRGQLKRMRRARGGRTLPRSGGGVHEDKKSKKLERELREDADDEIRNWELDAAVDAAEEIESNADVLDDEFWDEWCYPDLDDDEIDYYEEIRSDVKSKDKEKEDASTG